MSEEYSFEQIEPHLKSGDVILVREGRAWTSNFIKLWTFSPYYHAAVIFCVYIGGIKRWMVVEQHTGGQRIVSLDTYWDYDVFRFGLNFEEIGLYLIDQSGQVDYSYGDLVSIDVREKFGIKLPDFGGEVCSGLVANFLRKGGYAVPSLVSPQKLFELYKDKMVYKVRPSKDGSRSLSHLFY